MQAGVAPSGPTRGPDMPPLATLQAWLVEAYATKHALAMGQQEAELSHSLVGVNSVKFFATSPEKIEAHILWLQDLISRSQGRGRRAFYIT